MINNTLDRKKFSVMVENRVRDMRMGYLDAIISLCDDHNLDSSDAPTLISTIVKSKLEAEAVSLNYIKGGNTLPL